MNYLITGGAGFIGSHLCELLLNQGHTVIAVDNVSTGRFENIDHLRPFPNFQFVHETVDNTQVLDRLTSMSEVVVHLAATVGVQLILADPIQTIRTNINCTQAVLAAAHRYGCKVLLASTSEVYGKGVRVPFREDDDRLLGPIQHSRWAYAESKAVDEFLGFAYHQRGLPVIIMRFFNTIGPRQSAHYGMVVPRFVRAALSGEELTVYGDGTQSRCFADVSDVTCAMADLASQPAAVGQAFNIGTTEEVSILELAERIIQLTNSRSKIVMVPYDEAYGPGFEDMQRRVPSLDKIAAVIGFRPLSTLEDSLRRVIDYERNSGAIRLPET